MVCPCGSRRSSTRLRSLRNCMWSTSNFYFWWNGRIWEVSYLFSSELLVIQFQVFCIIFFVGFLWRYFRYSNDLYELQAKRWEWRQLRARPPKTGHPGPCPRLGHSFTMTSKQVCYVFGGLANDNMGLNRNVPTYLNDLYAIDLKADNNNLQWEFPEVGWILCLTFRFWGLCGTFFV